jgi:dUTP pyrophosphatase
MIKFEKVTFGQFKEAYKNLNTELTDEDIQWMYDDLQLPKRSTKASAGYDFKAPFAFELRPQETVLIPTGIRAIMPENVVLLVFPRSGLGFKFREQMDNTIPVIDADYYLSDNEGHIMLKITNDSKTNKIMTVERGKGFAQGIFVNYLVTDDDAADGVRNGGFGSTDRQNAVTH